MDSKTFQKIVLPHLTEAMLFTRSRLSLKSSNKFYPDKNMIEKWMLTNPQKYRLHTLGGDKMRSAAVSAQRKLKLSSRQLYQKVENDYRNGVQNAGNCGENARIAFCYLTDRISKLERKVGCPILILQIFLQHPVDHCLVLVGTLPRRGSRKLIENTLICDPWAKIVCPIAHYSLEWKMKMNKWSNRGLMGKCVEGTFDPFYDECSRESIRVGKFIIFEQTAAGKTLASKNKQHYSLIDRRAIS
jgi:hypothetical protein